MVGCFQLDSVVCLRVYLTLFSDLYLPDKSTDFESVCQISDGGVGSFCSCALLSFHTFTTKLNLNTNETTSFDHPYCGDFRLSSPDL